MMKFNLTQIILFTIITYSLQAANTYAFFPHILLIKKYPFKISDHDSTLANEYYSMAKKFSMEAQYDSAVCYYNKASVIFLNERIWSKYINCMKHIGYTYGLRASFDSAFFYLDKGFQTGFKVLDRNHGIIASLYLTYGELYRHKDEYEKAMHYYQQALKIWIKKYDPVNPLNDLTISLSLTACYNNIGLVYEFRGDYDEAINYFRQAITLWLKTDNILNPDLAYAYNNLGIVYAYKYEYAEAIEYYQKSLSIIIEVLGTEHPFIARCYGNLGNVYFNLGSYDTAMVYYNESIKLLGDAMGIDHPELSISLLGVGSLYRENKQFSEALQYINRSLNICRKSFGNIHPDVGRSYNEIASVYDRLWVESSNNNYLDSMLINLQLALHSLVDNFAVQNKDTNVYINPVFEYTSIPGQTTIPKGVNDVLLLKDVLIGKAETLFIRWEQLH